MHRQAVRAPEGRLGLGRGILMQGVTIRLLQTRLAQNAALIQRLLGHRIVKRIARPLEPAVVIAVVVVHPIPGLSPAPDTGRPASLRPPRSVIG